MNKTVMITGCAGFIGSHAAEMFLEYGYKVIGLDSLTYASNLNNLKPSFEYEKFLFIEADINDKEKVQELSKKHSIEWIINFAAETHVDNSIKNSKAFIHSNISGVNSLLEVCRETKVKLFHISTDEVYGSIKDGSFKETDILSPQNPYSATKAAAEHLIRAYANTYGINYIIVRPSNNFGPRQHEEKFIPTIIKSLMAGKKIPIYGDGKNIRDWLYVKDNVKAIEHILRTSEANETYNISAINEMENIKIVETILDKLGKTFEDSVEFVADRPGHDFRYSIENLKLLNLGFEFDNNFEENIEETINSLGR